MKGRILVHGGAGAWKDEVVREEQAIPALRRAVGTGLAAMEEGSAVGAVVEALASLEESGVFNAGRGAYPNLDGEIELDAGLMDGTTLRAGGVAAARSVPHPVRLARVVMERTEDVLVAGAGADRLARRFGLAGTLAPDDRCLRDFDAKRREYLGAADHRWVRELLNRGGGTGEGDTVGAVAMDGEGRFAAGTTTGGLAFKLPGRVGDSPLVGHGFYAMRGAGGASTSGIGEAIARYGLSLRAVDLMAGGLPAPAAAGEAISGLTRLFGADTGGIILLDRNGSPGVSFNTGGMAVGFGGEGIEADAGIVRRERLAAFSAVLQEKMGRW
ncbi:MAG TPA: isoaspartyl peptidase/L-asparaginase [Methanomicrobiales archaeon]|nr:isoaspartyl peptidase/L-asparaginase [Methanomicrobiales archaeon]